MQLFKISDIKYFMQALLQKEAFDTFLVTEGTITTFVTFHIDGQYHPDYFHTDHDPDTEKTSVSTVSYSAWKQMKPTVYALIRGDHTPLRMHLVFRLAEYNVEKLLKQSGLSFTPADIAGLYINILFEGKELTITTGTSMRTFTLDKSLDHTWDEMVARLLHARGIEYEII